MNQHTDTPVYCLLFSKLVITCLFIFGVVAIQTKAYSQMPPKQSMPKVGDQAPNFNLSDFKGMEFTLSRALKEKSVLLWFTNLCEGCQSKLTEVQDLKSQYEKKGIDVIAVSVLGEDQKTVEEVIQKSKVTLRFLYDPKGEATECYGGTYVEGTCPLKNIYIIQKGGKIGFASHLPGVSQQELRNQLDRMVE